MTTYLGKSCSFCLPRVPFVNCRQFMYLVISLLVLRAGYGIWLYQFLIIAYLFTLGIAVCSVGALADALRSWKYPYDQSCRAVRGSVRPTIVRTGYIYWATPGYLPFNPYELRTGPTRLSRGLLRTNNRRKSLSDILLAHFTTAILRLYGSKIFRKLVRACKSCRVITHLTRFGPLGSFLWTRH